MAELALQPALRQKAQKRRAFRETHHIGEQHLAKFGGQRRRVVTHLIRMRKNHEISGLDAQELLQRQSEAIAGVGRKQRMLDACNCLQGHAREPRCQRLGRSTDKNRMEDQSELLAQLTASAITAEPPGCVSCEVVMVSMLD